MQRKAGALIALVAWVGLTVQLVATTGGSASFPAALWVVLRYFTITTNLLVAVVFTGIALGKARLAAPRIVAGTALAILLVGVIYALLLHGLLELSGGAALADLLLHQVTPILVPLFWLGFTPKGELRSSDPLLWALYPLGYLLYALVRGAAEQRYAYPFIDVAALGWGQVGVNAVLIGLGFAAVGWGVVGLDRRLAPRTRI